MPRKVNHREVTPLLNLFRNWLRGRRHTTALRYADLLAARDQPPPNVPGGPYHKTSKIYYYTRDARREVKPPIVIPIGKQLAAGSETPTALKPVTPNKTYLTE